MKPEHRRTNAINVDLTPRERAALDAELSRHGLGVSDYIRRLIVAAHDGSFTPPMSTFELFNRRPSQL